MALNPPISFDGLPLRLEGEYFMLERKNIESEFKIEGFGGKRAGKGKLYITTARMIFVNSEFQKSDFKSFDLPIAFIYDEKFNQPIFGSNYLSGKVKPLYNLLPGNVEFKLWFTSGGCQTFLKCFCCCLDEIRKSSLRQPDPQFVENVRQGRFAGQKGFVDPDDPSVLYVEQPANSYNNVVGQSDKNNYLGQGYGSGVMVGSNDPNIQNNLNQGQSLSNQNSQDAAPGSYEYPRMEEPLSGNNAAGQMNNQNQPIQPSQPEINVGYYYGFGLGPQLRRNN